MKKSNLIYTFILGTRPEIIKMSPLFKEVIAKKLSYEIIHTGQHYSKVLLNDIWNDFNLPPITKKIKLKSTIAAAVLGEMITSITKYLEDHKRSYQNKYRVIIVQGDTNSTLAGALVANKLKIPLVHVEAGFRSGLKTQPEEINRILVDHMSDLNFATDYEAFLNLENDHLDRNAFQVTNTAYATANYIKNQLKVKSSAKYLPFRLMTIHRAENADNMQRLKKIWDLANELSLEKPIVWVMHPRTQPQLEKMIKSKIKVQQKLSPKHLINAKLIFLAPQGYKNFFQLLNHAQSIFSDSGGIVDEAVFLGKPYVCLRSETEQHEIIQSKRMILLSPELSLDKLLFESKKFETTPYPYLKANMKKTLIKAPQLIIEKIGKFF